LSAERDATRYTETLTVAYGSNTNTHNATAIHSFRPPNVHSHTRWPQKPSHY